MKRNYLYVFVQHCGGLIAFIFIPLYPQPLVMPSLTDLEVGHLYALANGKVAKSIQAEV